MTGGEGPWAVEVTVEKGAGVGLKDITREGKAGRG